MQCGKCQTENPAEAKFCIECASPLEFRCPSCGNVTPAAGKFCMECAHDLTQPSAPLPKELSFEEKIDRIQRFLPGGVTEKILAQRGKIEGERKTVTVLFCDMEGSTPLVEKLGPEEAYAVMDEIYEILIHKVHEFEGTVNEMTGDGIMALFGAPIAIENAPERAIRSALAIHREITRFNEKHKNESLIAPVRMRIGVHSGPVVVGTLGNDLRVEFKAVGDTVIIASRMEGLAEPGAIYVTEDTYKLTEGLFRFEALGGKEIKGREAPVRTFRVIAPSTLSTRFEVSAEQGLTPFIGRERELELLVESFERARSGRGQLFSITAEAGVGKTRLLYEFRKKMANEIVTFRESRCLSYNRGEGYYPITEILKSTFDIHEGDDDFKIREKVGSGLKLLDIDDESIIPYLLELFSVQDSGVDKLLIPPDQKQLKFKEMFKLITLKGSEQRKLIIVIEDLHWIDKSSESALQDLFENIAGSRVMLILTYRPEFIYSWGAKSYHSQLNLNRLSIQESLNMVHYLLDTDSLEESLEDFILEKTEGIPFFMEEFIKSLKELKVIEKKEDRYFLVKNMQGLAIPATIQDVIMARVDSLPEGAKEVIQTASAIEREFSHELISRSMNLSERELLNNLSMLKGMELIFERGIFPQSNYIFKHALTREVIYDSIIASRRKALHEKIGRSIEGIYKNNLVEHYGILAEHFFTAENYPEAAKYFKLAERKAEKAALFNESITFSRKHIASLENQPRSEDLMTQIIDSRVRLGLYFSQLGQHKKAGETIEPIVEDATVLDYRRRLPQIHTILGLHRLNIGGKVTKAIQHLEEALRISKERDNIASQFFPRYWLSMAFWYDCQFEEAIHHCEIALKINEAAGSQWGIVAMKSNLINYYSSQGNIDFAYKSSLENLAMAKENGDEYSLNWAYYAHGRICFYRGHFEESIECSLLGTNYPEKLNFYAIMIDGYFNLAQAFIETGDYEKAKEYCHKFDLITERAGTDQGDIGPLEAYAKFMTNEQNIDLDILRKAGDKYEIPLYKGLLQYGVSRVFLNLDETYTNETEEWINKTIETCQKNGTIHDLGRVFRLKAELYTRKDDLVEAEVNFHRAIDIMRECGAEGWVEKYAKELAEIS